MEHRISTGELRPGMFVALLDCSWLRNPFWRSSFLITTTDEIEKLRAAGIDIVVIDDTRGLGPIARLPGAVQADRPPLAQGDPAPHLPAGRERRARSRLTLTELDRARAIVDRSKAAVVAMFHEARLGRAVRIDDAAPLVDEIAASVARDASAMLKVTRLKTKDEYTYLHSVAVCALMINFARHLGLPADQIRDIGMAGLLHDIGKMAVPSAVLDKPGGLDDAEMALMRTHPVAGHAIISDHVGVAALVLDVCLHHHERIDGCGYPKGLSADQLSIHARMSAICDVYDAITSDRPYKRAWSPNEALSRMLDWTGHFDARLLDAFIVSIGIPPLGGLVRLNSNRLAVVIAAPPGRDPCTPQVRAFYAVECGSHIAPEDVETSPDADGGGDAIMRLERGSYWFGDDWPAIRDSVRNGAEMSRAA